MKSILLTIFFVLGFGVFANFEVIGQGAIRNDQIKLYENYNTYGKVQTKGGQTFICVSGSISRTNINSSNKNYSCSGYLTDNSKPDFGAMYIAVSTAEINFSSMKALERIEAKVNENTEATRKMQASIEQQNKEFNTQLQRSIAKSFDNLPLTILKQMRENQEFRDGVFKILFENPEFKKQIEDLIKESIGEVKSNAVPTPK